MQACIVTLTAILPTLFKLLSFQFHASEKKLFQMPVTTMVQNKTYTYNNFERIFFFGISQFCILCKVHEFVSC